MSATALLRRWSFELFRYAHYLYVLGVALVVVHAPGVRAVRARTRASSHASIPTIPSHQKR